MFHRTSQILHSLQTEGLWQLLSSKTTGAIFPTDFFFFWPHCVACGILDPQPGELRAPSSGSAES